MHFRSLFLIFILIGFAFAGNFSIKDYILPNETDFNIDYESFVFEKNNYEIVKINNKLTFLLKNKELITDKDEIYRVIVNHYKEKYKINKSLINFVLSYIEEFNESRNDGGLFKGQEENICRRELLLHAYPEDSDQNYRRIASIICGKLKGVCSHPDQLFGEIKKFARATFGIDRVIDEIFRDLENIETSENIIEILEKTEENIDTLENYSETIEKTIFRTPKRGEVCPNCLPKCPDLDLNEEALEEAKKLIQRALFSLRPLEKAPLVASAIYENTQARIKMIKLNEEIETYEKKFYPYQQSAKNIIRDAERTLEKIYDPNLKNLKSELENKEKEIYQNIMNGSLENIDNEINAFVLKINETSRAIENLEKIYENTTKVVDNAFYVFFVVSTSLGADDIFVKNLSPLISKKKILDSQYATHFSKPLSKDTFILLQSNYSALINEVEKIKIDRSKEFSLKTMANKFIGSLFIIITNIKNLTFEERNLLSQNLPILLSFILFLSYFSLISLLFIFALSLAKQPNIALFSIIYVVLILVIAGVSVGLYFALSNEAKLTLKDYLEILSGSGKVTIVYQTLNINEVEKQALENCALLTEKSLEKRGLLVDVYELRGRNCYSNGKLKLKDCIDAISTPLIIFKLSGEDKATFKGLFLNEASISGTTMFFHFCPIAKAISSSG